MKEYKFTFTPFHAGPVKNIIITIQAGSRKIAEMFILDNKHKFFDHSDYVVEVEEYNAYHT